jgi:hypothetical protein
MKLGMRLLECKPAAARLVPEFVLRQGERGEKKGPTVAGRALGVWERMPERPALCAAGPLISQVRKAQRVLRFAQQWDFELIPHAF